MDKNTLDSIYKLYMSDIYNYLFYLCKDKYMAEDLPLAPYSADISDYAQNLSKTPSKFGLVTYIL